MTRTKWTRAWTVLLGGFCAGLFAAETVHAQFGSGSTLPPAMPARLTSSLPIVAPSDTARKIEQVLLQRREWDFGEVPLATLVEVIAQQHQIPALLDIVALQDEGVDPSTPVPGIRGSMTVNKFLEVALRPLLCTHFIDDEVLHITTIAKAEELLSIRIYPVLDLVRVDNDTDDYSSLMYVIPEATHGHWEQIDGVGGTITPLPAVGSLVISQSWQVHREIEGLLQTVRQARRIQNMPSLVPEPTGSPSLPYGRYVLFGDEIAASPPQSSAIPAASRPAGDWRIPRVDRPGAGRIKP